LDTLVLITSALGFRLSFDAIPVEEMNKRNRNVAPLWASVVPVQPEASQGAALYVAGATNVKTGNTFVAITGANK